MRELIKGGSRNIAKMRRDREQIVIGANRHNQSLEKTRADTTIFLKMTANITGPYRLLKNRNIKYSQNVFNKEVLAT